MAAPEQPPQRTIVDTATTTTTAESTASEADAGASAFPVEQKADRFVPYYTMFHPKGDADATFSLFRPFQPFSVKNDRQEVIAYMTAGSDGQLIAYTVNGVLPKGPNVVGANISSDVNFSPKVTQIGSVGSEVVYGDLQMVPVGDSLVWTRPVYVESTTVGQPQVRLIVAYNNGEVGFGESLEEALEQLFPGLKVNLGDVVGGAAVPVDPTGPTADATASELLAQAEELFSDAEAALKAGDLGLYKEKVDAARDLVAQALDMLGA